MDRSSFSAGTRKAQPKSDIYSTFVVHNDDDAGDGGTIRRRKSGIPESQEDLYGTMVYKENGHDDDDEDSSLPPLLKRLPKDFGGGASMDYDDDDDDDDDEGAGDFGTMIVKTDRSRQRERSSSSGLVSPSGSTWKAQSSSQASVGGDDDDDDDDGGGFGTFVVRSTVRSSERESTSGTVVRRTAGGSGAGSTMERAVASMQAAGEFGKHRKGSGSSQNEDARQQLITTKISASSIPESVTREDPTTKYELLNELGKGSYGAVYKARDLRTSEMVAIKVISLSEGEEGYEEIRGEIEMLQQCNHPNVVRYLGSYQGEEYLWIVMEYCGGGSVADLMSVTDEALDEGQIAYICREALKGLEYLHSIFKVHRDIKGGNILLTEQGDVKLGGKKAEQRSPEGETTIATPFLVLVAAVLPPSHFQVSIAYGDFGVAAQLTRTMSKRNTFIGTPHWMAPEVIQESRYDGKDVLYGYAQVDDNISVLTQGSKYESGREDEDQVDVWALGVSAIEMAEGVPPRSSVHPMRVLFMISIEPAPMLEDKEKWSLYFHDFVAKCLTKEPRLRPTASEMLKHKFFEKWKTGSAAVLPKLEKARQIRASMALQVQTLAPTPLEDEQPMATSMLNDEYGDTVPSGHQNLAVQEATDLSSSGGVREDDGGEGNFGTMIVHGDEVHKITQDGDSAGSLSAFTGGTGLADSRVDTLKVGTTNIASFRGSNPTTDTIQSTLPRVRNSTEQNLKTQGSFRAHAGIGSDISTSMLKNDTVFRKSFALQDKLWSIYAAGNTVPIPFLRATDISPIALLSDNVLGGLQPDTSETGEVESLQELFSGDVQSKKGRRGLNEQMPLPPSIYQRLTSSSTLMNLAQALAYHKMCYEDMPLQELQATQEQRTIQNLSDTLRTILRL
ncbi:hypothetical protein Ahy_A03g015065 isoform B [Arachis hypogaea]|uniref:non-specific serine/threonine protein kinase n=1 Tax=Arachis hypogaea TaxID=3818 RepID=A0A445DZS2_ARAHY|nr:hypothetical protein Ahy_A03g015065 isoform B [Arachis hypogaea]